MSTFTLKATVASCMLAPVAGFAIAQDAATYTLRIQSHYVPEQTSRQLAGQFVDRVQTLSNSQLKIEMCYASSVVKTVGAFDAAATGILDGERVGAPFPDSRRQSTRRTARISAL